MTPPRPLRSRVENALGVMSVLLLVMTVTMPDWIERIFGLELDGDAGRTEWGWTIALAVTALLLFADARRTRSRSLPAAAAIGGATTGPS
jgi:H+/Cl- antiporter ClcA